MLGESGEGLGRSWTVQLNILKGYTIDGTLLIFLLVIEQIMTKGK